MEQLSGQVLFPPKPRPELPLSVVVVALEGGKRLERCVRALLRQDVGLDYEIVVADPHGDPDTLRIAGNWAMPGRPAVRYLSARRGAPAARNAGWQDAAGAIVAFTDDRSVPRRSWLRRGHAALAQPAALAAAGCVRQNDGGDCPDEPQLSPSNCFLRREVLREHGGFDERFRAGGDQVELLFALQGGIVAAPRAVVVRARRFAPRPPLQAFWRRVAGALASPP